MRSMAAPAPARPSTPGRARRAERPDVAAVLRLQRTIGNRRTGAVLRKVRAAQPTTMTQRRGEFPQIMNAHHPGGLNAREWGDTVRDAKAALAAGKLEEAARLYTTLYRDLALTAGAVKLRDVANGAPIHLAKSNDEGFAPGLNLVLGSGGSKGGSTAFVDAAGRFGVEFDKAVKAGTPRIAIRLFGSTFSEDKAATLGVLRHEMLHARHREQAIDSLGGPKGQPRTAYDKAVVRDIKHGGASNTELLAYVEGFMTTFHLTNPAPGPKHAVFIDLLGMLETSRLYPWRNGTEDVRDEALGRLREYYCNTLGAAHRAAFDAWVATLEAQVTKDLEALRAGTAGGALVAAKLNAERMFDHFTAGMREVVRAACPVRARRAA